MAQLKSAPKGNPIAKALRSPHLKHQVVTPKTSYSRKAKHRRPLQSDGGYSLAA